MSTILLVDDEFPSLEALRTRVDWKKAGFDLVLTADSVRAAKEQFARHRIEVLLSDIEMPQETGLDLLQWIKSYSPETVGVFLTCHADFRYAKEAVKMGAFDYLLKPAGLEDIEKAARSALEEWERRHQKMVGEERWKQNSAAVMERFWWEILNDLMPDSRERIKEQIRRKNLNIDADAEYLLVSCAIRRWNLDLSVWEKYDLDYTVKNILGEIFEEEKPYLISDTIHRTWILFRMRKDREMNYEQLCQAGKRFQEFLKEYFKTKSCFYVGTWRRIEELSQMKDELCEMEKNNVSYDDAIFSSDDREISAMDRIDIEKEQEKWTELLQNGNEKELCIRLRQVVSKMVSEGAMNAEMLRVLYHEVLQVVYSVLAEHNISARQLLESVQEEEQQAFRTSADMLLHLEKIIHMAIRSVEEVRNQDTVVGKVRQYIEEHIGEDLSRNLLADLVYLNPNYLSRLFRSETGYSLVDYITQRKIARVRKLLTTTDLSVSEIAQQLGYTNMPYFSRVFKKETGCSPLEYRKGKTV